MTYVITTPCIDTMDQSCVDVCPVDCIHFEEGLDKILYIDPDECIDCGACEPACPVSAVYAEDDVPEEEAAFTEINALWFTDKDAARAKITAQSDSSLSPVQTFGKEVHIFTWLQNGAVSISVPLAERISHSFRFSDDQHP